MLENSALVQELYKPLTARNGHFIRGKFDQIHRDIPYAPLTNAFKSLIRQLLTSSESQIGLWRDKLVQALGASAQIIVDVIPELEIIIGPQAEVATLPPMEAQNRFHLLFLNFINVFTSDENPLVLFLDDLQWADAASLTLMESLLTAGDSEYLFLIGAYRTNEVSATHRLKLSLDKVESAGCTINHLSLAPLSLPSVAQLIADALRCEPAQIQSFAELVFTKTEGNPFFINEFLQSLYSENLLTIDSQKNAWRWDLERIRSQAITDNVAELMVNKLRKLTDRSQHVIHLAACIGNRFDLQTLAIIDDHSIKRH